MNKIVKLLELGFITNEDLQEWYMAQRFLEEQEAFDAHRAKEVDAEMHISECAYGTLHYEGDECHCKEQHDQAWEEYFCDIDDTFNQ